MEKRILQFGMTTKAVMIALLFGMAGKVYAYDFLAVCETGQTLYYNITDATNHYVELTYPGTYIYNPWSNYTIPTGNIILPTQVEYEGIFYSVKSIGERAFYHCNGLTESLTIPNTIVSIGRFAFLGCTGLNGNLTLNDGLITIGGGAFNNCSGLIGSLIIPDSVITIDGNAFSGCSGFSGALIIGNSVISIGHGAFNGCNSFVGDLIIPNSVTEIGGSYYPGAFQNCSGFTGSLILGNSISIIGTYTFSGCSGFTGQLIIPNSVTTIGAEAFLDCEGFTGQLVIPNSVITIGEGAFYNCSGFLSQISIPSSVTTIHCHELHPFYGTSWYNEQEDGVLYLDDWCLGHKGEIDSTLIIQEGTLHIAGGTFIACNNLTSIIVPNSVTDIGAYAFGICENLSSVTLSTNLTSISDDTFAACNNLYSIKLPNTINSIGIGAFGGCGLCSIVIPNSVTSIGGSAFGGCPNLSLVVLGNSVETIADDAFDMCEALTKVISFSEIPPVLESGFNYISENPSLYVPVYSVNAYQNASVWNEFDNILPMSMIDNLVYSFNNADFTSSVIGYVWELTEQVTIPTTITIEDVDYSVTSIDRAALSSNTELISIDIPNSIISIEDKAFWGCAGISSIVIPNSVVTIGERAFMWCTDMTSIILPNSLLNIGDGAFEFFQSLISINIPNAITTIPNYAFGYCSSLISISIPNSVTRIMYNAFIGCSGLISVTFGNPVSSIGYQSFNGCSNLSSITINTVTPPTIQTSTFLNCPKSIPVYVPCGSLAAYQFAAGWNEFTNIQENCSQSQTITLNTGWNWCSFNLDITLDDLKAALVDILGNTSITIKSQNSNTSYNGSIWRGQLASLDVSRMYMIQVGTNCQITLTGTPINPDECPITIYNGNNWIAFPLSESMSVSEAFSDFAVDGDIIKSQNSNASYNNGQWRGSLTTLEPGRGYIYKSNANEVKTFVFPSDE